MTWTTRPPQHHFDGSDATKAIRAQRTAELTAQPDGKYWQDKAHMYAAKCADNMGLGHYRTFMGAYDNAIFELHTWKEQAEAYQRLYVALLGWQRHDEMALHQAFGWEVTA